MSVDFWAGGGPGIVGRYKDRDDLGLGKSRLLHQNLLARLCQIAPIIAGPLLRECYETLYDPAASLIAENSPAHRPVPPQPDPRPFQ